MYIIVAIVTIENFIYFYAYIVRTHLVSLGFLLNPVMLVLGTYFAYSKFVVEKFTVKKKSKTKKMYCFYRINLLECVPGVRFEVVNS